MTLTKADLVQQVYKNHEGLTKAQATASVEAFLRLSKESLIGGSDLLLVSGPDEGHSGTAEHPPLGNQVHHVGGVALAEDGIEEPSIAKPIVDLIGGHIAWCGRCGL